MRHIGAKKKNALVRRRNWPHVKSKGPGLVRKKGQVPLWENEKRLR